MPLTRAGSTRVCPVLALALLAAGCVAPADARPARAAGAGHRAEATSPKAAGAGRRAEARAAKAAGPGRRAEARAARAATPDDPPVPASTPTTGGDDYPVPPPPFSEGVFPCSGCHADLKPNLERRSLEDEHAAIRINHGPRERWCFDCHSPDDRDRLRLASGSLVPFSQSYRLCGQCHGDKYRDWRAGVHGRRTGQWDGDKKYLLCVNCHNAHSPRFAPIQPMPTPRKPQRTP